ncbi:alpha/beta hydrolase [Aggregatilinea lenta]|uniref:alpha/beta hydrolase n=1 Tax=Aggregatilinea lenta TaxID=913108 RepID=UPI001EE7CCE2|nr:alpha/beta fold hydrolase [Aggregatilinea lenta]
MADGLKRSRGLHQGQPVLAAGEALENARAVMVMLHGRGASAESILGLTQALDVPGYAYWAPQAADHVWYPHRFLEPLERNEPFLSSALAAVDSLLHTLAARGFSPDRVILLGFSQGACLALEYAARHAQRFGGVIALSGALIGAEGTPRDYPGSLDGTPIFIGCDEDDQHVPARYVTHSEGVLAGLGAEVTARLYANIGHAVIQDEVEFAQSMMRALVEAHLPE